MVGKVIGCTFSLAIWGLTLFKAWENTKKVVMFGHTTKQQKHCDYVIHA